MNDSAFIPREFLRDLAERADIAALVGERVKLEKRGRNLFGLCPFHAEKTPSFSVNPEKGFYHCFGCGAHGTALDFIKHNNGGDFVEAVRTLAGRLGAPMPRRGKKTADVGQALSAALAHWQKTLSASPAAREYLKKRGVEAAAANRFRLGYAADGWDNLKNALSGQGREMLLAAGLVREKDGRQYDYFRHRLMFPIFAGNDRLLGFGGRGLGDEEPKYLNSPESAVFSKRYAVFGLPQALERARQKNRIIVTEGYMDVVMLSQGGFAESVATMGTAATAMQMEKIIRAAQNIFFAFDGDEAGQKAAWRALEGVLPALRDGTSVSFVFLPSGEDPDSFIRRQGAAAFEQLLSQSAPLGDYLAEELWRRHADGNEEGQASGALKEGARLLNLLSAQRAPYLRDLLSRKLSAKAKLPAEKLHRRPPPKNARGRANYRMRPESRLFNLLCCLSVNPRLPQLLEEPPPLIGGEQDSAIVAELLSRLQWREEDGEVDIIRLLEEEGWATLARQVQSTIRRRFAVSCDIEQEFRAIVQSLRDENRRRGRGKAQWLRQISENMESAAEDV